MFSKPSLKKKNKQKKTWCSTITLWLQELGHWLTSCGSTELDYELLIHQLRNRSWSAVSTTSHCTLRFSLKFEAGRCDLCQKSTGRHITCGQYNECQGFRGPSPLSLPWCCGRVWRGNHLCAVEITCPAAVLKYSTPTAQRAPHGQAASLLHATVTTAGCFPCATRAAAAYRWGLTRAQLQGIPVLLSLYQKVENKLTYLFFIYAHENISNFSLCQITWV